MRYTNAWLFLLSLLPVLAGAEGDTETHLQKRAIQWPSRILAPYCYLMKWPEYDIGAAMDATGHKLWTLAFITGNDWGDPAWSGYDSLDDQFYHNFINKIRNRGGDVIVSFGGAAGHELALVSNNEWNLADKYQQAIDKYKLTYIDIDIEGGAITHYDSIERRSKALKIVRDRNPGIIISYTLPVAPFGLVDSGLYTIKSAVWNGLKLDVINLMTMDYGSVPNGATGMGGYAISAAEGANKQIYDVGMRDFKIGITPMIGKNDVPSEIFRVEDAKQVADYAKTHDFIRLISYWSINRDTDQWNELYLSSQISQKKYDFVNTFKTWSGATGTKDPLPVVNAPVKKVSGRIFAPFVDILLWPTFDINKAAAETNSKWFTLAFINSNGNGDPAWGGNVAMSENFYLDYISKLRASGGDIIISFGGAIGQMLAASNTDVTKLQRKYQAVIDLYKPRWIDFDVEGDTLSDTAANDRRAKACAALKIANPGLTISVTLPAAPNGLTNIGYNFLVSAKNNGFEIDVVNIMAMNFGSGSGKMAQYTKSAAEATRDQVKKAGLSSKIGITPMIGKNDVAGEIFTQDDARTIIQYAKSQNYISYISFWSSNRDNDNRSGPLYASSQVSQSNWEFSNIFKTFNDGTPQPVAVSTTTTTTAAPEKTKVAIIPDTNKGNIPSRMFAPYCDILLWPTFDVSAAASATGNKWYTLAFITANGAGNPAWGSSVPTADKFYLDIVDKLRNVGGDIIISFGGAIGQELAVVTTDVALLKGKYQSVIDIYKPKWIDFDIEGGILSDEVANTRRAQAIARLKTANPGLITSITLPVFPTGLTAAGISIISNAVANGWKIDVVNIMTMDYGSSMAPDGANSMGKYAISAAEGTYSQCIKAGLKDFKIGVTPMIGKNDVAGEIFTLANAHELVDYALQNSWISHLSYWSINRDNEVSGPLYASSQIKQSKYDFSKIFGAYSSEIPTGEILDKPGKTGNTNKDSSDTNLIKSPLSLDTKIFAPYCDILLWPTFDVTVVTDAIGIPWFTLAFVTADTSGNPAWGSIVPTNQKFYISELNSLRSKGGDAIVSFGGAIGQELAVVSKNVEDLQKKYQSVIDDYQLKWVDFDVEGAATADQEANNRRALAFKGLKAKNPGLIISVTLPVMPDGLTNHGISLIKSSVAVGGYIDVVNIMTMDYGSGKDKMGEYAISAAKATFQQIQAAGLIGAKVGITPMIGQNDVASEIFTLKDAQTVASFVAETNWIAYVAYWSINRDTSKSGPLYASSQINQETYAFAKIFKSVIQENEVVEDKSPGKPSPYMPDPNFVGGYTWSKRIFAAYALATGSDKFDLVNMSNNVGSSRYTLGFITAGSDGRPAWGGTIPISKLWYLDQIQAIRNFGGNVIISFGGKDGLVLARAAATSLKLQMYYQNVVDAYTVNWIDFYLIGDNLKDKKSVDNRNVALRAMQMLNPNLRISYTLPASPAGLGEDAIYVVKSALNYGVRVDAMSFDQSVAPNAASDALSYIKLAAAATYDKVTKLGLQTKLGITVQIGKNENSVMVFRNEEAIALVSHAKKNEWINMLSFWAANTDKDWSYSKKFVQYEN